ncbi:ABC transporter substrate-binding protein [Roseateles violae]|uniref:ABC transporter substrate-binding protein n=1 Tax=Roseateles violae TaxID=3058042 RepID=A0ABT8DKP7_9BURK|nr:ABC transporter substrate-binding protein [Pelomonas sp. PFR6]MDN3918984.1 ABC transporter substrate-binding protein [Pelomonas sp. PFR6]
MKKNLLALLMSALLAAAPSWAVNEAPQPKVLRYAFRVAETGFDPAKISDIYSRGVTAHIFEGLYSYDQLARPAKLIPLTAEGMPEHSADFKTWTIRIKPGILFADDPAFGGKKRELVAEDYIYAFKRVADPKVNSSHWSEIEEQGFVGLAEYRNELRKSGKPYDYDKPIPGLRALDRHTLQFQLEKPRPRLPGVLAQGDLYGAMAREVVEAYPDKAMEHPVGTGPFVLKEWRRSSRIVLERNPNYRERVYEAQPAADDAEGQALLAKFKGRRLPMIDRVEISIIEENQPRWLSFLGGEFDFLDRVPDEFITQVMPQGKLAPNLAKKGMRGYRVLNADVLFNVFNMEDPVIGGYTPERVALRRAIGLATDVEREIRQARRGQAIPAQSMYMPYVDAYDPEYKSEMSEYDPARAKALLDLYGYVDKDGDGWREQPDGSPLVLESLTTPDGAQRQIDEIWQKALAKVGLRVTFKPGKWPENLKALRAGKFQIWSLGASAAMPDSQDFLTQLYGPHIGGQNYARFRHEAADRIFERTGVMPDGPERVALFRETKRIVAAYMPYKYKGHRYVTDLVQAQLSGYRRHPFKQDWWEYVDIEAAKKPH